MFMLVMVNLIQDRALALFGTRMIIRHAERTQAP